MHSPSLSTALSGRDNSLNAVRLILASAVIVSHAPLGGYAHTEVERLGPLAVNGFFALSGFLIAGSRLRNPFGRYMERRARRIFPGFWACLAVTAFVFAPIGAFLGTGSWNPDSAFAYVVDNALLYVFTPDIGSTLEGAPSPGEWNGPLWSLVYEFLAYLAFGALLGVAWVRRNMVLVGVAVSIALPLLAWYAGDLTGHAHKIENILRLFTFFAAGMLAHTLRERLPRSAGLALASAVIVVCAMVTSERFMHLVTAIPLTYLLLYIGGTWRTSLAQKEDVSFGMYIYGWPVQQVLALAGLGALVPSPVFAVASIACTIPLAIASWRLVEKPAMRTRRRPTSAPVPAEPVPSPNPAVGAREMHVHSTLISGR